MPSPGRPRVTHVRKNITLPGLLESVVEKRWTEFFYPTFSPYALELICFDLRARRSHSLTRPLAFLSAEEQEEVDREIVHRYIPNATERNGPLIEWLIHQAWVPSAKVVRVSFRTVSFRVNVPKVIAELLPRRVRELRYPSFSAYVTGLVRYDLMLGGPHKHFDGTEMDPERLRALDEWTVATFHERRNRKTFIDYRLEEIRGRAMTKAERDSALHALAMEIASPKREG